MRKAALSKDEMLERLLAVFRRDGFSQASTVVLMQAIGLQKGSLYHHFPGGKTQMGQEVLGYVHRLFADKVFRPLREEADGLAQSCDALGDYFASGAKVCLPALMALGQERDLFAPAIAAFFQDWEQALVAAYDRAGWSQANARRAVMDLQGAIILSRAQDDPVPFHEALRRMREGLA